MSYRRDSNLEYADVARKGFLVGVALFALGAVGEVAGHTLFAVPSIAERLFFGMIVVGVGLGLLVPIVFGVVLPLLE